MAIINSVILMVHDFYCNYHF